MPIVKRASFSFVFVLFTRSNYRRFSLDEDVSTQTAIKSSAIRAIKQSIEDQFPATEQYMDVMIPKKSTVLEGKG